MSNVEKVVPTMSVVGFVTDPVARMDRLLAYWLTSQYSQSYCYYSSIHSFQKLIQENDGVPDRLAEAVQNDLKSYLTPHFDNVDIKTSVVYPKGKSSSKFYHLVIKMDMVQDSVGYNLMNRVLELNEGKFKEVVNKL